MTTRLDTIQDYHERMNRVLDHIRQHLDEPLNLNRLADLACFSPFHFHRIFAAYVGEPVSAHVRRLRLELAAHRLCHTRQSITDIALSAGYETPGAFNKAFKRHFRVSPTRFQKEKKPVFFSQPIEMAIESTQKEDAMKPEMKNRSDTQVLYVRRTGKYNESARTAWGAVCGYAFRKGLVEPDAEFIGLSHDDPDVTPEDKLRYDACISVKSEVKPEGEVGVQTIPGGNFAVFLHKGPYENLYNTYKAIYSEWLPQSGAQLRDASCFEKYLNDASRTKPADLLTEIYIPVT
jgi:AraC family transcriptional regulator